MSSIGQSAVYPGPDAPAAGATGSRSGVVVRRSGARGKTKNHWLEAWHSFNFGRFQEPGNGSFGVLIVFNDDIIQPGQGFASHHHRDLEIITWPVAGRGHHRDSVGNEGETQNNFYSTVPQSTPYRKYFGRLDYQITPNIDIHAAYNLYWRDIPGQQQYRGD